MGGADQLIHQAAEDALAAVAGGEPDHQHASRAGDAAGDRDVQRVGSGRADGNIPGEHSEQTLGVDDGRPTSNLVLAHAPPERGFTRPQHRSELGGRAWTDDDTHGAPLPVSAPRVARRIQSSTSLRTSE